MYDEIVFLRPAGRLSGGCAVVRDTATGRLAEFSLKGGDLISARRFENAALKAGGAFFEYDGDRKSWIRHIASVAEASEEKPYPIAHQHGGMAIDEYVTDAIAREPERAWALEIAP